jgi:hypothetical protein
MIKQQLIKIPVQNGAWTLAEHAGDMKYSAYFQCCGSTAIVCHAFCYSDIAIADGDLILDNTHIPLGNQQPVVSEFLQRTRNSAQVTA